MGDKALQGVPILTRKENYREWALGIRGASLYHNFWHHYQTKVKLSAIKTETVGDGDTATTREVEDEAQSLKIMKLKMRVQGALILTTSMVIKMELDTLKDPDVENTLLLPMSCGIT